VGFCDGVLLACWLCAVAVERGRGVELAERIGGVRGCGCELGLWGSEDDELMADCNLGRTSSMYEYHDTNGRSIQNYQVINSSERLH